MILDLELKQRRAILEFTEQIAFAHLKQVQKIWIHVLAQHNI